ncbi:MAG: hypothetical protein E6344_05860 [Clostridium sp.]|uniref:hypothetical protein n=1 Tax=Clostridium culturomicium TaxID=1499683 RepID=UPI00290F9EB0|nr:hypothetical protein [Clostridium sp.]MDU7083198.1 hypothetical protein [Clostridium sp.]
MKKAIKFICITIILTLPLSGCSKNKIQIKAPANEEILVSTLEEITSDSINMSYSLFTGYRSKVIDLDQCETCNIDVNVTSNSGDLDLTILDAKGEIAYKETSIPTGSFSLSLAAGTRYTIRIDAMEHVGNFSMNFLVNE